VARDSAIKSRSQAAIILKALIINALAQLRDSLDKVKGSIALVRHMAAFRPGVVTTPTALAKAAMRVIAKRWLFLHEEIQTHDLELAALVELRAPKLMPAHGIGAMTAAEMLILVGDNPERIKSEAARSKLWGVCPIPASSGKTNRMRLNRGGNRQANAALYIVPITRMRNHEATKSYVVKRTAQGKSKREIIRCLKRYIVCEIYNHICVPNDAKCAD
jgi:transposase